MTYHQHKIPFNRPFIVKKELEYIQEAVNSGKISGNGIFTKHCHNFFKNKYGFRDVLLTSSCTDALEMAAILINIEAGDEVIVPSFTFVSTANAFVLRGAKIVFADSESTTPNIDCRQIEKLITKKTKAIVPVHYAGIACDMDMINKIAKEYKLFVIEDAAQAIDSFYKGRALGSLGHFGAFSFHETKNIISGEGGMLTINESKYINRAEIVWEKGTNRSAFWRNEVDKYGWVDIGSSFLPSEITSAFLFAQLECLNQIQTRRKKLWDQYYQSLESLEEKGKIRRPTIPKYATNNGHMFYLICNSLIERTKLIEHLKDDGIYASFHYQSLHKSFFYRSNNISYELPWSDLYTDCLIRLPLFYELSESEVDHVVNSVNNFFK